jgi:vacuolar protein sorting-associated protein VTA1
VLHLDLTKLDLVLLVLQWNQPMISHLLYVVNPASDGPAATSYTPTSNSSAPTHYHSTAESSPQLNPPAAPPASQYKYDSSYQPEVEKIAEAHKAARFAVGAFAFMMEETLISISH